MPWEWRFKERGGIKYLEKWNLGKGTTEHKLRGRLCCAWLGKAAPCTWRGPRDRGPHWQQCTEGVKGQLFHWSLLMRRHYILAEIYIKWGKGQKHVIHWENLPVTPREDEDLNWDSHTTENDVDSLRIAHCPTYWQPMGYTLPRIAMNVAQLQVEAYWKHYGISSLSISENSIVWFVNINVDNNVVSQCQKVEYACKSIH